MFQTWQALTTILTLALLGATAVICTQQQMLTRLRHEVHHDPVTGLANRRAVTTHLRAALRGGRPTGLVLLDLDRFKTINDTYGHEAGNDLLTEIGHRLATLQVAVAARLSGDEFALIVHGDRDHTAAVAHAAARAVTDRPIHLGQHHVTVSASVGHATATLGITTRQLLHTADVAMYRAKNTGCGRVYGMPAAPEPAIGRGPRYRDLRAHPTAHPATHDSAQEHPPHD